MVGLQLAGSMFFFFWDRQKHDQGSMKEPTHRGVGSACGQSGKNAAARALVDTEFRCNADTAAETDCRACLRQLVL
jgi:hypothetical protein